MRVLLADRNYDMLDYLAVYLSQRMRNVRVSLESDGRLMRAIGATLPDIVVAGAELEEELETWDRFRRVSPDTCPRLILLVSKPCADERALAVRYGATDCLKKPVVPTRLLESVIQLESVLRASRRRGFSGMGGMAAISGGLKGDSVMRICLFLGMSVRLAGYEYIRECVQLLTSENLPRRIRSTELFGVVASRRGTAVGTVERLIRYALAAAWKRGYVERANLLLGEEVFSPLAPPSGTEFIFTLARVAEDMRAMEESLRV